MENNNKVWILSIKWATQDADDQGLTAFPSKEKAHEAFLEAIQCLKECDCPEMFNEDGTVADGYVLEETENSYYIYEEGWEASNFEEIRIYELGY